HPRQYWSVGTRNLDILPRSERTYLRSLSSYSESDFPWVTTPYSDLISTKPSTTYFGRVRVNGKLIRSLLETQVLSDRKLKLSQFPRKDITGWRARRMDERCSDW